MALTRRLFSRVLMASKTSSYSFHVIMGGSLIVLALCLILSVSMKLKQMRQTSLLAPKQQWYYVLHKGQSLNQLSRALLQHTRLHSSFYFKLYARLHGFSRHLQAGGYLFHGPLTVQQLLTTISQGKVYKTHFTIIDGWRFTDLEHHLAANPYLDNDLQGLTRQQIADTLKIPMSNLDGAFYADTYHFPAASKASTLLQRAHQQLIDNLNQAWRKRQPNVPYHTKNEALIVASLIEQETLHDDEKPLIAGIILNRLKKHMRLQLDATVVYALGARYHGRLHHQDLLIHDPYNTYLVKGLPPGPIAYPDRASIMAALHPQASHLLYFYSKANGYNVFAKTLKQHNHHIHQYGIAPRRDVS